MLDLLFYSSRFPTILGRLTETLDSIKVKTEHCSHFATVHLQHPYGGPSRLISSAIPPGFNRVVIIGGSVNP